MADVTGGHQAADNLLRATAGVALELRAVADEDPAHAAPRHLLPALVEDAHLGAAGNAAGAARRRSQVLWGGEARVCDLGGPVHVVERVPKGLERAPGQVRLEL